MTASPAILWFRLDLRLRDNPALKMAIDHGGPVIPLYVWAPEEDGKWLPGGASKVWLHHSLTKLDEELRALGSQLVIRKGSSLKALESIISQTNADAVFWNRRYEPSAVARDSQIKSALKDKGIMCESFNSALLIEPWENRKKDGTPYKVFTPFSTICREQLADVSAGPSPRSLPALPCGVKSDAIASLDLLPAIHWDAGIRESWEIGERAALAQVKKFATQLAGDYEATRNLPAVEGVSRLSPYLHFGEIGPRQVWSAIENYRNSERRPKQKASAAVYQNELLWREFSHHLLFHFPHMPERPLRGEFEKFPWETNHRHLRAWQQGKTGYPIVDAGMRQLWQTGWMHNRVRMIVGSFLVKDLLIDWREGERWFWDTLVDADLAQNPMNWQWVAGCGADAAPFFRIFNPVTQSEKFDDGAGYIHTYVPELGALTDKKIHRPWEIGTGDLLRANLNYGNPLVDHSEARQRALEAYSRIVKLR